MGTAGSSHTSSAWRLIPGRGQLVLNHSKVLAWIGIGTALLASILGGSRIEVQPFASSPYSLGLDWVWRIDRAPN